MLRPTVAFWLGCALVCLLHLAMLPSLPTQAQSKVVGDGTAASCTAAALASALEGGGAISFDCGSAPVTMVVNSAFDITAPQTSIDGGGLITLEGQNSRIFEHRTFGLIGSSELTLQNLTITKGQARGTSASQDAAYEANGGAIRSRFQAANPEFKPTLNIVNVRFVDNDSTLEGVPSGREAYDYGGGAIYSQGGALIISDSEFLDNDANNGGGGAIHILQSGLTISDSRFENNTAIGARPQDSLGGAIYIDGLGGANGRFAVSGSVFRNNRSYNSGGAVYVNMYENSSSTQISTSSFEDNAVVGGTRAQGGAIGGGGTNSGGDTGNPRIAIETSTFARNSVTKTRDDEGREDGSGGALSFPQRARLSITNSTFTANRANGSGFNANGGALYVVNNSEPFSILNSTFAGNSAGWVGGAISNSAIDGNPGGSVRNTLFVDNSADNGPNDWTIQQHCSAELSDLGGNFQYPGRLTGGNFFNDVTCFVGKSAPDQTDLPEFRDPQLGALQDNGGPTLTMAIDGNSPAVDAGDECPASDQRGVSRPQGAGCDSGAYELVRELSVSPGLLEVDTTQRTITVRGYGFSASSKVQIDGEERTTEFVDAKTLRATLSAADVAQAGTLSLSVSDSDLPAIDIRVVAALESVYLPLVRR